MTRVMSRRRAAVTGDQIERIAAGPGGHRTGRLPATPSALGRSLIGHDRASPRPNRLRARVESAPTWHNPIFVVR